MSLASLLGLANAAPSAATAQPQPLTPDQLDALPYVNVPNRQPMQTQSTAAPPPQQPAHRGLFSGGLHVGSPLGNLLGTLGDILLVGSGGEPIYQGRLKNQRIGEALNSYLGNTDQMLSQVFHADPSTGVALYKIRHPAEPDFMRDMRAAGIDPQSDEGKQLVSAHFGKQPVAGIAEYQYYKQQGGKLPFGDFLRILHPPAGGSLEETGGAQSAASAVGEVTATNPQTGDRIRLNPSTGQWEPM
jgi:hypothetical protein